MQALVFRQGNISYERTWVPRRAPAPGDVRVRVRLAGICATDLEITRGYMGFEGVLGHEFVGEALEGRFAGKRVVGEINAACGACSTCRAGLRRHCSARTVLGIMGRDGAFAASLMLPETNLHAIPEGISDERAVFTEPLAAAFEILEQGLMPMGAPTAVLGDGRLGLLCAFVLATAGARVTLLGRHESHLERARARGIAVHRVEGNDIPVDLRRSQALVVDATGSPRGIEVALDLLTPRGTLVLKTTTMAPPATNLSRIVIDEIRVVGSRCGPFEPAIRALASGAVAPEEMVERTYPLSQGIEALRHASQRGVLKVLLRPEE